MTECKECEHLKELLIEAKPVVTCYRDFCLEVITKDPEKASAGVGAMAVICLKLSEKIDGVTGVTVTEME